MTKKELETRVAELLAQNADLTMALEAAKAGRSMTGAGQSASLTRCLDTCRKAGHPVAAVNILAAWIRDRTKGGRLESKWLDESAVKVLDRARKRLEEFRADVKAA